MDAVTARVFVQSTPHRFPCLLCAARLHSFLTIERDPYPIQRRTTAAFLSGFFMSTIRLSGCAWHTKPPMAEIYASRPLER